MSKLERRDPRAEHVRLENIGALLLLLARRVHAAKQENRQGWTIGADLEKMKDLIADLEALDSQKA